MEKHYFAMLWMIVLSVLLVVPSTLAATYTVGDNFGWNTPNGGDPFGNWASRHTFAVGDILVFNFNTGSHTVANVSRFAFDSCNTGNPLGIQTNGPARFMIEREGTYYFICTLLNHCSQNQRLSITTRGDFNRFPNGVSPTAMATKTSCLIIIIIGLLVYLN